MCPAAAAAAAAPRWQRRRRQRDQRPRPTHARLDHARSDFTLRSLSHRPPRRRRRDESVEFRRVGVGRCELDLRGDLKLPTTTELESKGIVNALYIWCFMLLTLWCCIGGVNLSLHDTIDDRKCSFFSLWSLFVEADFLRLSAKSNRSAKLQTSSPLHGCTSFWTDLSVIASAWWST